DGIRDGHVTGVQTCALPISPSRFRPFSSFSEAWRESGLAQPIEYEADRLTLRLDMLPADDAGAVRLVELDGDGEATESGDQEARSEERRVGKECRSVRSRER